MEFYLIISSIIIFFLGRLLYSEGSKWSIEFMEDKVLAISINKILLILYYLLNIGLVFYSVIVWENHPEMELLILYIFKRIAYVLVILGSLHLNNVILLILFFHFKIQIKWKL